jgi:CubicO group peptidase (beta-lactamase class C family)
MSIDVIHKRILRQIERRVTPSISAAWVLENGSIATFAFGFARLNPPISASPETVYPWFSVTKLFTATAVLRLVAAGKISLDEPASQFVPTVPAFRGAAPTIGQLLNHTSGLVNPLPLRWIHGAGEPGPNLEEMTERLLKTHRKLKFAPGERFSYSNLNYLVLGLVIEQVTGRRFNDYVTANLLVPVGAKFSGFGLPTSAARGYTRTWSPMGIAARAILPRRFLGPTRKGFAELNPFQVDGAPYGGLIGTASDMLLLGCAMLGEGVTDGQSVLPASLVHLALRNTRTKSGEKVPIGLGWHLAELKGEPYAHHLGGGIGFRSELRIYPRMKRAIAVIANETSFDTATISNGLISCQAPPGE